MVKKFYTRQLEQKGQDIPHHKKVDFQNLQVKIRHATSAELAPVIPTTNQIFLRKSLKGILQKVAKIHPTKPTQPITMKKDYTT